MNLPLLYSVVGLIPLCENMPSGNAVKPGDIVRAMNGKTIEVHSPKLIGFVIASGKVGVVIHCYACHIYFSMDQKYSNSIFGVTKIRVQFPEA